ncbi:hypothetical protein ABIC83_003023 [Roseateles asaccharophilus]|uniref:hypothetical protein n=1 Tax=Roseateles asaccharophilus TaxID=582607 RepID=UPI0038359E57
MPITQIETDGEYARDVVRGVWPNASSMYTGPSSAQVYDPASGAVLGEAKSEEFVVEHAWVAAARKINELDDKMPGTA